MSSREPGRRRTGALVLSVVALGGVPPSSAFGASPLDALSTTGTPGERIGGLAPRQAEGGYIAKLIYPTTARSAPGGRTTVAGVSTTTPHTGNATQLMVIDGRYDASGRPWLNVQLAIRPNGTAGWIPADSAFARRTSWFVRVRLGPRTVSVHRSGRLVRRVRAVIGKRRTPTPTGQFALYEVGARPRGDFLGPWALHTTAFSDVLKNYGGGPGRVALHGRGPASRADAELGEAASHGCVRVDDEPIRWMRARLEPGTPVRITQR